MDKFTISIFIVVVISMITIASLFAIQIDKMSNEIIELESDNQRLELMLESCQVAVETCTILYNGVRP
jgi:hypothetical protein